MASTSPWAALLNKLRSRLLIGHVSPPPLGISYVHVSPPPSGYFLCIPRLILIDVKKYVMSNLSNPKNNLKNIYTVTETLRDQNLWRYGKYLLCKYWSCICRCVQYTCRNLTLITLLIWQMLLLLLLRLFLLSMFVVDSESVECRKCTLSPLVPPIFGWEYIFNILHSHVKSIFV